MVFRKRRAKTVKSGLLYSYCFDIFSSLKNLFAFCVKSPIGTLCRFARFFYPLSSALPTLPPKEEASFVLLSLRAQRSNLPGGWVFARHILLTLMVGYFAYAQYDVLLSPIVGVADTSPEGGSKDSFRKLCPKEEAGIVFGNLEPKSCNAFYRHLSIVIWL